MYSFLTGSKVSCTIFVYLISEHTYLVRDFIQLPLYRIENENAANYYMALSTI